MAKVSKSTVQIPSKPTGTVPKTTTGGMKGQVPTSRTPSPPPPKKD